MKTTGTCYETYRHSLIHVALLKGVFEVLKYTRFLVDIKIIVKLLVSDIVQNNMLYSSLSIFS